MDVTPPEVIAALRAGGCVWAEEEAAQLAARFDGGELAAAVARRVDGLPLEHVLGFAQFCGIEVELGDGCFVPRARAAALVDVATAIGGAVIVDLGTGCGAIAAAFAARVPSADVHGVELDAAAREWAEVNAATFGFAVHAGRWWTALPPTLHGQVDLAVAYLPHVPTANVPDIHPDFRAHEPASAVDGGPDGLDHLRTVVAGAADWLRPAGAFVTLVSSRQVDAALELAPFGVTTVNDGEDAVLVLHRAELEKCSIGEAV